MRHHDRQRGFDSSFRASRPGRFLEVDPVEGGTGTNDYAYVRDPVNLFDLNGQGCGWNPICHIGHAVKAAWHWATNHAHASVSLGLWQVTLSFRHGVHVSSGRGIGAPGVAFWFSSGRQYRTSAMACLFLCLGWGLHGPTRHGWIYSSPNGFGFGSKGIGIYRSCSGWHWHCAARP